MAAKLGCPIARCGKVCQTTETLNAHLYSVHRKHELAAALTVMMDLAHSLRAELADLKQKWASHV